MIIYTLSWLEAQAVLGVWFTLLGPFGYCTLRYLRGYATGTRSQTDVHDYLPCLHASQLIILTGRLQL